MANPRPLGQEIMKNLRACNSMNAKRLIDLPEGRGKGDGDEGKSGGRNLCRIQAPIIAPKC